MESVEEMKEFFLSLFFFGEELHVVHNEKVVLTILIFKAVRGPLLHRVGIIDGEFFRGEIKYFSPRVLFLKMIADGLYEMRFPAARVAVNE